MGFLQRLSEDRSYWTGPYSPKTYTRDPALKNLFGSEPVYAGVDVNEYNAFTFSAVFDAVNQISSDVGKLPKNLRKRRKEGGSDVYLESKVYWLLKYRANPEMTAPVFWRTIIAHALTCHGGFAEIVRDQLGRPSELWILTPNRVQAYRKRLPDGLGPLGWKIDGDEGNVIPDADMLHIHGLGYDGINGYGVIAMARQTIGLALAAEKFGAQYFGRGTMFGGHLAVTDDLDADQKKELIDGLTTLRMQQDAAFRIMVTDASSKFTQFSNRPTDSQMDETRVSQVLEVARFFRMPPVRLGVTIPGAVSYASAEISNQEYYTGALLDWITMAEAECWAKLIPLSERAIQYVKFNANVFLRGDSKSRAEFYGSMLDRGVFCADDVLDLEDMNPQPGGQGKMYLVQGAQVPKDQLAALVDARIKKDSTPPPAPVAPSNDNQEQDRQRLEAAEQALTEARAHLETERTARVDAEATGRATAEELMVRRTAEIEAAATLGRLTAVVEELRADLASRDAAIVETASRAATLAQELEGARATLAERSEAIAVATREAETARTAQAEASAALTEALERVTAAEAAVETAGADRAAATAALETAQREARQAQTRADEAEAARADLAQHADSLREASERSESEVTRLTGELATATAESQTLRADVETARAEVVRVSETSQATSTALETRAATAEAALTETSQALEAGRESTRARLLTTIAAHRGLFVDAMGRMTRREASQARTKQATPAKLRRWLEDFASVQLPICVEALVPAMRTHLAWTGSDADPVESATTVAREHIAQFTARLQEVVDGPAEEFHGELETVLSRWESDRAGIVADAILAEEVRHVGR